MDKQMKILHLFRDSKMVVEWAMGRIQINAPQIQHLLRTIKEKIGSFETISFKHIYMELNMKANKLSKLASFETVSFKHIYMELNTEADKLSKLDH